MFPSQIGVNQTQLACSISNLLYAPTCNLNTQLSTITLVQVTPTNIIAGTVITVTISGLINSKFAAPTDSFQIYTMTQDGFYINYAYQYLTVTNDCDYPCVTCNANDTARCNSCNLQSN